MNSSRAEKPADMSDSTNSVLIHDLRGPTLNAMAFNKEIMEAATRLSEIMSDSDRVITPEERVELSEILAEDINPCVEYAQRALQTMEERLNSVSYSKDAE